MQNSTTGFDYTDRDYEGFRSMMIKELQKKLPWYTDTSESDAGIVLIEVLAKGLDVLSFAIDTHANENFLITAERRDSIMDRCYELAYSPYHNTPSYFRQVFVLSKPLDYAYVILKGTVIKTPETATENSVYFETLYDLVIPRGKMGDEKDNNGNYLYTVPIVQGVTINGELLGSSTGVAEQQFSIKYSPVLLDTVSLVINEGYGYEQWTKVDSFIDSEPTSKHFRVLSNEDGSARITFGDGVFGKIPNAYVNGIFAYYRVGGGTVGNVSRNTITLLDQSIGEIASTFNPEEAYTLGMDRETIDSIKVNAPNHNRTKWGAITLEDHTALVQEHFNGVIKYVTSLQDPTNPDKVLIYVLPIVGSVTPQDVKDSLLSFFDMDRQFVGGEVAIKDAVFKVVNITANILVDSEYVATTVKDAVNEFITNYFAVGNYDFNTPLYLIDLENEVKSNVVGVKSFRISVPSTEVVTPLQQEIIKLGTLTLTTTGGRV